MIQTKVGDLFISIYTHEEKPYEIKAYFPVGKMYVTADELNQARNWVTGIYTSAGWPYDEKIDAFMNSLATHGETDDDDGDLPAVIHLDTTPPPPAWLPGRLHPLWPVLVRFKSELITAFVLIVLAYLGVDHLGTKQAEQTEVLREQNVQLQIQNKLAREQLSLRRAEAEYWQIPVPAMRGDQP